MELVINLGAEVGMLVGAVEKDRVFGLERDVLVDEELERFTAGVVELDNWPKSLVSSAVIEQCTSQTHPTRAINWAARAQPINTTATRRKRLKKYQLIVGRIGLSCFWCIVNWKWAWAAIEPLLRDDKMKARWVGDGYQWWERGWNRESQDQENRGCQDSMKLVDQT
jgi:hypothetical protein